MIKFRLKTFFFVLMIVSLTIFMQVSVFATDTNKYVKVGLTRDLSKKSQITINNTEVNVGYGYENFQTLPLNLVASSNFVASLSNGYFVQLPEIVSTADDIKVLQDTYNQLGLSTVIEMKSNSEYSLLVGPFDSAALAQEQATLITANYNKAVTFSQITGKIALSRDSVLTIIFTNTTGNPQVTTYVNGVNMNISSNYIYRGAIEFKNVGGFVQPVSVVALEKYLYGLVPAEMPSSWAMEALKAQSVAARTYALSAYASSKHTIDGYHLCDSTHCQVYKGVNNEAASTNAAVDATVGQAAYHNGTLIEALFYSSNGGSTANSEDVWSGTIPYLRAKADTNEPNDSSWTREFTQAELTSLVLAKQQNLGVVQSVTIDKTDNYGRALALTFRCTNGNYTVQKDAIRTFFASSTGGSLRSTNFKITQGLKSDTSTATNTTTNTTTNTNTVTNNTNTSSNGNNIDDLKVYSNGSIVDYSGSMITVSNGNIGKANETEVYVVDKDGVPIKYSAQDNTTVVTPPITPPTSTGGTLVLKGGGWGHGVGLSQFGAKGMADKGATYDQILNFYYTNVTIN